MIAAAAVLAALLGVAGGNPQPLDGVGTKVTCYSCSANNGQGTMGCNSGSCMGLYCTYSLQHLSNGQSSRLTKGCSDVPQIPFDDGTVMTQLNTCQTKNSMTGSTYNAMICNTNYCNADCTPGGSDGNPQRDPTITCNSCEMANAYDCTGGTCQGTYCIYERSTPSNGIPYVKRYCSFTDYAIFPDNTHTQTLNQCERKTVNGVSYAIEVCNSGSFCDTQCNSFKELSNVLSVIFISIFCLLNL